MKDPIYVIDRQTGQKKQEKVFCEWVLSFLYESRLGQCLVKRIARASFLSSFYGWWQQLAITKGQIAPFVARYKIDVSEFEKPIDQYSSFNAFFIRKLKPEARYITPDKSTAIIPADGRYLVYQNIDLCDGFVVKGKKFSLTHLLDDPKLAKKYEKGSLVIARLCPTDYHRFHFPCDCIPGPSRLIQGFLYSVNPISIKQKIERLTENKRTVTELKTDQFSTLLYVEVGAMCVGSIHQTYTPSQSYEKGREKGYFSFGGSTIILLFEPNQIQLDKDLIINSLHHIETVCLMGQSLGKIIFSRS